MPRTVMALGYEQHLDRITWAVVAQVADAVAKDANRWAPRRSGDLAGSYIYRRVRRLTARVGSHLDYARHVELGTEPHIIRAHRKKALRFSVGGSFGPFVLRRAVNHPGAAARPHLRPALYRRRVLRMVR